MKILNASLVCREDYLEVFETLHFLPGVVCVRFESMAQKMEDKVVHELYKMQSFFWLCASVHKMLPFQTSAAEPSEELVARSAFLFAATCCGVQRLNSRKKQLVFPCRDLGGEVGFTVLVDQSSSTSLRQWLTVLGNVYLDQSRVSFFSSEPQNLILFSSSRDCTVQHTVQSWFCNYWFKYFFLESLKLHVK